MTWESRQVCRRYKARHWHDEATEKDSGFWHTKWHLQSCNSNISSLNGTDFTKTFFTVETPHGVTVHSVSLTALSAQIFTILVISDRHYVLPPVPALCAAACTGIMCGRLYRHYVRPLVPGLCAAACTGIMCGRLYRDYVRPLVLALCAAACTGIMCGRLYRHYVRPLVPALCAAACHCIGWSVRNVRWTVAACRKCSSVTCDFSRLSETRTSAIQTP
jgi:hypothetical protein